MFNADGYHWTEDNCTSEGVKILVREFKARKIEVSEITRANVYIAQRMGSRRVGYDLALVLRKEGREHSLHLTSLTAESEIEPEEVREETSAAIGQMKEGLLAAPSPGSAPNPGPDSASLKLKKAQPTIPQAPLNVKKTEEYRQRFVAKTSAKTLLEVMFTPGLATGWSNGFFQFTTKDGLVQCSSPALTLKDLSITGNEVTALLSLPSHPGHFSPLTITLREKGGETEALFQAQGIRANTASLLTSTIEEVYCRSISRVMNIPFRKAGC
ncbi:hypothetical protein NEDG_01930 [Nematocida displodere]|uniref:Uncharacterized protein n=1 Tax=Nematocida displodere TaxID=1805483 RepID=A0A177EHF1_9MICR|nr:hypothetical protein NEDG_01930 [Nematocida displodere]